MPPLEIGFLDRDQDILITERKSLPHWAQRGVLTFMTWRTWDSIPRRVAIEWKTSRDAWLRQQGIDPNARDWKSRMANLPLASRKAFRQIFAGRWEDLLDRCEGECVLRQPALAEIVASSLRHFDGERYTLTDFVVMPNHVHLIAAFPDEDALLRQAEGWKHYTATQINRRLGRSGRFWEVDGFDHLIRSFEQYEAVRQYIADNPVRAGLDPDRCLRYSIPTSAVVAAGPPGHSRSE